MQRSLTTRLILAFLLVAAATAALVALLIRLNTVNRLNDLIIDQQRGQMQEILEAYYTYFGTWNGIDLYWQQIEAQSAVIPFREPGTNEFASSRRAKRVKFGLADQNGLVLIGIDSEIPAGSQLSSRQIRSGTAIEISGQTVGTLISSNRLPVLTPEEALFLRRTNQALLLAMVGAMLVALIIGTLLARSLTRPIQLLTDAAKGMAQGRLKQQVDVTSQDEIGQLTQAFNQMSLEISRSNELRQQMTADIAHDLRTPLTVVGGYLESMRDGVLPPTPQRLALIYSEIERLQKMVADLRTLSQADAGELTLHPQDIVPAALLERARDLFEHQASGKGVTLKIEVAPEVPSVWADEARLMQVLDNLISNALRYTASGGTVILGARAAGSQVELSIQDTGEGIDPAELPHIFNRFHRADKSRHAEAGESGLGLAIVRALVESQGGHVTAESAVGQGTTVRLLLPHKVA